MVALLFYAIMSYLGSIKLSKYLSSTVYIIRYLLLSRRAGRKNISKVKNQMTQVSFEVNLQKILFPILYSCEESDTVLLCAEPLLKYEHAT